MSNTFLNSVSSENIFFYICEILTSLSRHFLNILPVLIEFPINCLMYIPFRKEKER